jgi:hypothetical protein
LFSPNDEPFKSYFYVTDDPEKGNWKLITRTRHFHDASLLFDDDDKVYVFTSNKVFELSPDFKTIIGNQDGTEVFRKMLRKPDFWKVIRSLKKRKILYDDDFLAKRRKTPSGSLQSR